MSRGVDKSVFVGRVQGWVGGDAGRCPAYCVRLVVFSSFVREIEDLMFGFARTGGDDVDGGES